MFGSNRNETIRTLEKARDDAQRNAKQWSERVAKLERVYKLAQSDLLRVEALNEALIGTLTENATERDALRSVLFDIMGQETPSANATVKRMGRMAREALGHDVRPKGAIGVTDDQLIDLSNDSDLEDTKNFLAGKLTFTLAFVWEKTKQGYTYWEDQSKRDEITPEARAIIEASVRRAEGKS